MLRFFGESVELTSSNGSTTRPRRTKNRKHTMTTEAYNAGVTESEFNDVMAEINATPEKPARYIVTTIDRRGNASEITVFGTMADADRAGRDYGCKIKSIRFATSEEWSDAMREAEYADYVVRCEEGE